MIRPLTLVSLLTLASLTACTTPPDATPTVGLSIDRPAADPAAVTVPLHLDHGHLFVPVEINGKPAGWFLLDTGAGVNAVGMGLAGRLDLPPVGTSAARGIAGTEAFDLVQLDRWSVGGVALRPTRAARLNMHRFTRGMAVPAQGILGFAALRHLDFTIDYPSQTLTLTTAHDAAVVTDPHARPVRVTHRGGVPRITALPDGGPPVSLVLDTGANGGIAIPMAYLLDHPGVVAVDSLTPATAQGLGGVSRQQATWLRRVELLGVALDHVPVRFEQHNHAAVGRVGHDALRHFRLQSTDRGTRLHATRLTDDPR
jgi:hypothetical protein